MSRALKSFLIFIVYFQRLIKLKKLMLEKQMGSTPIKKRQITNSVPGGSRKLS